MPEITREARQHHFDTNSIEIEHGSDRDASPIGPRILAKLDIPGNWSGKGQHVEFGRGEPIPLEQGEFLGRGSFADVHEVTCQGISVARKQIYCARHMKIEEVKRELDILKKLSHKHVVTLLGSYTQNKVLGLLLHPVAVCDLGVFLDELDEEQKSGSSGSAEPTELGEGLSKLMTRLGLPVSLTCARERLNKVYGCLAAAIRYLHEHNVRHKDIKPRNVLLDRNDGLYITDFGLSRDTTDLSSSVTNGVERGTYKYCAPEVARYEPRGRAADIYSLGCVFLEVNTVYRRLSLTALEDFRIEDEDRSYQNKPQKLLEWMSKLRQVKIDNPETGVFDIVNIIERMVSPDPSQRPAIGAICSSLYVLGDLVYFGKCCATSRYQALIYKNSALETQYAQLQYNYKQLEVCCTWKSHEHFSERSRRLEENANHEAEKAAWKTDHDEMIYALREAAGLTAEKEQEKRELEAIIRNREAAAMRAVERQRREEVGAKPSTDQENARKIGRRYQEESNELQTKPLYIIDSGRPGEPSGSGPVPSRSGVGSPESHGTWRAMSPRVSDGVDLAQRRRRRIAEREPRSNYGSALVLPTAIHHREHIGLPQHVTVHETDGSGYSQQSLDSLPYKARPSQSKGFLRTVLKTLRGTAPSRSASGP